MTTDTNHSASRRFGLSGLAGDVAWTLSYQLLSIVTVAASFMMLGRELGSFDYGEYVGLFAVAAPLSTVGHAASLSVVQFTFREGRSADEAMARFWSLVLSSGVVLAVIAVVVSKLTLSLGMVEIVAVAVSELIVASSIRVIAASERLPRGVGGQMRIEIANTVVRFAVLAGLYMTGNLNVRNLAIGWLVAFTAFLVVLVIVVLPRLGRRAELQSPRRPEIDSVVHMGAPIFANNFQLNGDKIVLNAAGLKDDAGLYGAAFRVISLATLPLQSIEAALFHRFLESDDDAIGQHTGRAVLYSLLSVLVVLPVCAVIWFAAPQFHFLVGDEFEESETIIRWLVLWLPFQALSGVPLNAMMGLGRFKERLWVVLSSAALSMLLYLVLIPGRGWEGAVIGTVISEIYLLVAAWLALLRAQRSHDSGVLARS